jgi:hypothetical protein
MPTNRHHLYYPKREYAKHTMPNLLRQHPVNIHETETWRHDQLHHNVGTLAVMSEGLARASFKEYEHILQGFNPTKDRLHKFGYFLRTLEMYERIKHGRGAVPKEAGYFAEILRLQQQYITPME